MRCAGKAAPPKAPHPDGQGAARLRLELLLLDLRPPVFFLAVMLGSSLTPMML